MDWRVVDYHECVKTSSLKKKLLYTTYARLGHWTKKSWYNKTKNSAIAKITGKDRSHHLDGWKAKMDLISFGANNFSLLCRTGDARCAVVRNFTNSNLLKISWPSKILSKKTCNQYLELLQLQTLQYFWNLVCIYILLILKTKDIAPQPAC